jgi:hypothetical protein
VIGPPWRHARVAVLDGDSLVGVVCPGRSVTDDLRFWRIAACPDIVDALDFARLIGDWRGYCARAPPSCCAR